MQLFVCVLAGNTCINVKNGTEFCIFKSNVLAFCGKFFFPFFLVNSECDVYLPADYNLVYSYHKISVLFLCFGPDSSFKIIFPESYLGVTFAYLSFFLNLGNCKIAMLSLLFSACKPCSQIFHSQSMLNHAREM